MATYSQWQAGVDREGPRRINWVCGVETFLVEEVIDTVLNELRGKGELDYHRYTAGDDPEHEIWSMINQHPLAGRRIVFVRNVEKIQDWQPFLDWLVNARAIPDVHLLLVSSEADTPKGPDGKPAPHIAEMMARRRVAALARCSTPNPTDMITWVRRRGLIADDETAIHLLTRIGGNVSLAGQMAFKLALFNGRANKGVIDALCEQEPGSTFVDSLLMLRKADAFKTAASIDHTEFRAVIGQLARRLDFLFTLHKHVRDGSVPRPSKALPYFLIRAYQPVAKFYDRNRCRHARNHLAMVDDATNGGVRDGILEALVALW